MAMSDSWFGLTEWEAEFDAVCKELALLLATRPGIRAWPGAEGLRGRGKRRYAGRGKRAVAPGDLPTAPEGTVGTPSPPAPEAP